MGESISQSTERWCLEQAKEEKGLTQVVIACNIILKLSIHSLSNIF